MPSKCPLHPLRLLLEFSAFSSSIHAHALLLEIRSRLVNLPHQFLVCFRNIVECENAESELEEEVCAEGDESPDGELVVC